MGGAETTRRWPVEDRLEAVRAESEAFVKAHGAGHEAKADQATAAIRDVLIAYGVDVYDRAQMLGVVSGCYLVATHGLSAHAHQRISTVEGAAVHNVAAESIAFAARLLPPPQRRWTLTFDDRPFTLNGERKGSRYTRAATVRVWRSAFTVLARQAKVPKLDRISVVVQPVFRNAKSMQDTAGCMPAAKAAIDGVTDAGVIPDDSPAHLIAQTYRAPLVDRTRRTDCLQLTVIDEGAAW